MLTGKKIILGVTASIAAYKAALLTRLLVKQGAEVQVIMTEAAKDFITPLTLATLSKRPALSDLVRGSEGMWNNHVELGLWADALVIAPASANTLAKCAQGLCDNLLLATYLSARCPVFFAPAMDLDMYAHPATRRNIDHLLAVGNHLIPAEAGELASGLSGEGRMAEPEHIVAWLEDFFVQQTFGTPLSGKRVLITAGPTQEDIDPVRFISNHSSGKMGYALAQACARAGADVCLVSGPTHLPTPRGIRQMIQVRSAHQMYEATQAQFAQSDLVILSAAVADFAPAHPATQKIKKKEGQTELLIELTKTIDIAHTLGQQKQAHQFLVGFALETENQHQNAQVKLDKKNFDVIILNSPSAEGTGFGYDTNRVSLIDRTGKCQEFGLQTKSALAQALIQEIATRLPSI